MKLSPKSDTVRIKIAIRAKKDLPFRKGMERLYWTEYFFYRWWKNRFGADWPATEAGPGAMLPGASAPSAGSPASPPTQPDQS